jgi:glycosyltransferase involved in cell wall biosynthesis
MDVRILGTRGIPASHGGFETFAERLGIYLSGRGHRVTVYCQRFTKGPPEEDTWKGIRRVILYGGGTPIGSILFDLKAALHASRRPGVILTLGYNTAVFSALYVLMGKRSIMNMDGLEWQREKWSRLQRFWLRVNEKAGAKLSDHLIADHPEIGAYLSQSVKRGKISVIPYEYDPITTADAALLKAHGLTPDKYAIVIARAEPENSLLEIVEAFSRKRRGIQLLVLGKYYPETNKYHRRVMHAAGPEVTFADAVYEKKMVQALRVFSRAYVHGHRVGGTNPSLVESLAAGNPIIAHDNRFTRWVAGPQQQYFSGAEVLSGIFDKILDDGPALERMAVASRLRHRECFLPEKVLPAYEELLLRFAGEAQDIAEAGTTGSRAAPVLYARFDEPEPSFSVTRQRSASSGPADARKYEVDRVTTCEAAGTEQTHADPHVRV